MDVLLAYLNSLSPSDRDEFAARAGTTVGYLRKAISSKQKFSAELAARLAYASHGRVGVKQIRPDLDWALLQSAPIAGKAQGVQVGK